MATTVLGVAVGLLLAFAVFPAPVAFLDPGIDSYPGLIISQALAGVAFLGTAVVIADDRRDLVVSLARLGVRRFRLAELWLVPATFILYLLTLAAYGFLVGSPDQRNIARDLGIDAGPFLAVIAVFLIAGLAPVAEELFFRGMFFGGLRVRYSFLPAALISAAVFGGLHLPSGASAVPPLVLFGFLLAWLYERTRSVWPAIIMHAINNALVLAISS